MKVGFLIIVIALVVYAMPAMLDIESIANVSIFRIAAFTIGGFGLGFAVGCDECGKRKF